MLEYLAITRAFAIAANMYLVMYNKDDLLFRRLLIIIWSVIFTEVLIVGGYLDTKGHKDITEEMKRCTGLTWIQENIKY